VRAPYAAANFLSFSLLLALGGCGKPSLDVPTPLDTIGQATPVTVHVHDVHGVSKLTATVEQNGARYEAWQSTAASKNADSTFSFRIGTKTTPQLRDGKAHLILEATSGGLLHGTIRWERDANVITQPPTISADSDQHYLYLGMADLATLNVTGAYTGAGIRVGNQDFRAWPMPGGKPGLFSLYAFAWNMPAGTTPLAFASNGTGSDVTTPLTVIFPKREQPVYTQHEIQVTDQFMQKVLGELDPNGTGDPAARFVKINSEMRKANNQTLSDLRFKTADHFLWSQPFTRQSHSQAEATLRTCVAISITERRSTSRFTSVMTLPSHSMSASRHRMTAASFGLLRSASTATALWSITATDCRRSTDISAGSMYAWATWSSAARLWGSAV
jgi:hypothetical protein